MLTECKSLILKFLMIIAHRYNVGSDGCIARWSIFEAAIQDVSGMPYPNYRRHSMRHTNGRYERSTKQTGSLLTDCFNVSLSPPGRSELKNWQNSSCSISIQDQLHFLMRDGAWMIPWMRCCLHVQHCLPLSMSTVRRSYNSLTSL